MEKKLSFIVPVYKCEPYLDSCLESIYGAGVEEEDFEVILVNDGSPDNSAEICRRWAAAHGNIVYVEQENQGASPARNTGLRAARGEWLWFVDSDDEVDSEFLSKMVLRLDDVTADLVAFNYRKKFSDHTADAQYIRDEHVVDGVRFFYDYNNTYLWCKVFRKASIEHLFLEGTKNIEDLYFCVQNVLPLKAVLCISGTGYCYNCTNQASTSRNTNSRNLIKLSQDTLLIQKHLISDIAQCGRPKQKAVLEKVLAETLAGHLYSLVRFYSPKRIERVIEKYKKWGVHPILARTQNRKMNLFIAIANHPFILKMLNRMYQLKAKV